MSDVREQLSPQAASDIGQINHAFAEVAGSAAGKRVLFWMLEQCAIYQDAFSGDDAATNYKLGQQASGRKLIAKLDEIDPRFYPKLLIDIADIKSVDRAIAAQKAANQENDDHED